MKRTVSMMAAAMLLPPAAFIPSIARAQQGAVVQALPPQAAVERLNSNLAKLSRTPQDVDALLGAGKAALDLGDVQAANGFYTRANLVNPNLAQAKLGLATVQLALKQPQDAAANFDAAERLGATGQDRLADRGLAYDLTGQQAKAQRDYQAALQANPDDMKARTRYAVSLGISGKLVEADKMLEPALRAGDREAWRFRAFIYAMNGRPTEARNVTQSVMPKGLADALEPYMVRVPLLTPAQKAAAAHYGDFPANVLRMTPPATQVAVAAAAPAPVPAAQPATTRNNDRRSRNRRDETPPAPAVVAAPAPQPAQPQMAYIPPPPPPSETEPPRTVQTVRSDPQFNSAPTRVARADTPAPQAPAQTPRVVAQPTPAPTPVRPAVTPAAPPPQPATAPARGSERTLAAALTELSVPEAERSASTPAVDLNALAKARADKAKAERDAKAKAEKDAKAKAEAAAKKKLKDNPSRIFVQIAAGKNESALAFDMRRFRKNYGDAIGDEGSWYFPWGETNRLLIGPYRKEDSARAAVSAIKKAGGDAFVWTSDAGDEVQKIGAK